MLATKDCQNGFASAVVVCTTSLWTLLGIHATPTNGGGSLQGFVDVIVGKARPTRSPVLRPAIFMCVQGFISSIAFAPVLRTSFFGDDVFDSLLLASRRMRGETLFGETWTVTLTFATEFGKFQPLGHLSSLLFHTLFPELSTFKAAQFLLSVFAALSVGFYVLVSTKSWGRSTIAVVCFVALVQLRPEFDALTGFAVFPQGVIICLLVGASTTLLGLANSGFRGMVLQGIGLVLLFCVTLMYEIGILGVIALLPQIVRSTRCFGRKPVVAGTLLVWLLALVLFRLCLFLLRRNDSFPLYKVSIAPDALLDTTAKHLFAIVPGTSGMQLDFSFSMSNVLAVSLTCALLGLIAGFFVIEQLACKWDYLGSWESQLLGWTLILAPALAVAVTYRWQNTLEWGQAYFTVIFSSVGVSLVIAGSQLINRRFLRKALYVGASASLLVNLVNNVNLSLAESVSASGLSGWMNSKSVVGSPREAAKNAVTFGLLDDFAPGSHIWAIPPSPWLNSDSVSWWAQKDLNLVNTWARFAEPPSPLLPDWCLRVKTIYDCTQSVHKLSTISFWRSGRKDFGYAGTVKKVRLSAGLSQAALLSDPSRLIADASILDTLVGSGRLSISEPPVQGGCLSFLALSQSSELVWNQRVPSRENHRPAEVFEFRPPVPVWLRTLEVSACS